jgi:SAM-dependent methyltransferase
MRDEGDLTARVRENYDRLAIEYARNLFRELEKKPLDRQLLDRFATETAGRGKVCDIGCGPGQVARYLRDAGADVFGLDLSPEMIGQARSLNPDINFLQGDMSALDLLPGSLAGIAAFYAIVNIRKESLPLVFREMQRTLQLDGLLLLAFHIGEETLRPPELWGEPITMDWFFFPVSEIKALLEAAGFFIEEVTEREPYAPDVEHQSRRAYIFARKPAPSRG